LYGGIGGTADHNLILSAATEDKYKALPVLKASWSKALWGSYVKLHAFLTLLPAYTKVLYCHLAAILKAVEL
jgi:hypothetical protein